MRTSLSCTSLLAAAACGCALLLPGCARSQANPGPPPTPEVGVVALEERPLVLTTVLSGRTAPYVVAEIRPQVGGIVRQRPFQEGSDVAAGQLLYEIEPATYKAAVDSAAAALARDEATLATAQLKATRYAELVRTKAVSEQENDDAQMAVRQGIAVVAADKAALDAAKVNLGYTRVTSPIAGRIGRSAVTQGALVTAGQPNALATVQRLDPIYVDVTQSSAELLRLKRDLANGKLRRPDAGEAEVRLTLEDGTEYPLAGRLALSEATVEQSTGTVTLRAVFPNPDRVLLPGMFVRATVKTGEVPRAVLAPQRGVTRDGQGNATALVLGRDGKVELRKVQAERALGANWLVESGLAAGDRLIVDGLQKVRPGDAAVAAADPSSSARGVAASAN